MNVVSDKLNFCKSCGVVHGIPIAPEYIHFYENMHKIKKKSVYHRKYHIRNKIIDVVQDKNVEKAIKIFNVEKEVVVVHRGSYDNSKCIIVCLTM